MGARMESSAEYVLSSKNKERIVGLSANRNKFKMYENDYGDDFYLVIHFDYGTADKKVFRVPYSDIKKEVMSDPRLNIEADGSMKERIASSMRSSLAMTLCSRASARRDSAMMPRR